MKTAEFCENRLTNKRDNTTVARTKAESQKRVKETPKARIKYTKRIKNTAAVVSWVPKQQHVSSSHKDKHKNGNESNIITVSSDENEDDSDIITVSSDKSKNESYIIIVSSDESENEASNSIITVSSEDESDVIISKEKSENKKLYSNCKQRRRKRGISVSSDDSKKKKL